MPTKVLNAYKRYQEGLLVRNAVADGLGLPYRKPCSIPQGCPMSMMIVAYIMRPWVLMMRSINVVPRVLADDFLVPARGERHAGRFTEAFEFALRYLIAIGAKWAALKSQTWSSNGSEDLQ